MKLITPVKIGVLPGDGRYLFGCVCALHIAVPLLVLQKTREDRGVVKNDAVGNQAAAFGPEILLVLGPILIIVGLLRLAKARVDRGKGNDSVSD